MVHVRHDLNRLDWFTFCVTNRYWIDCMRAHEGSQSKVVQILGSNRN